MKPCKILLNPALACGLLLVGAGFAVGQQVHRVSVIMEAGVALQDADSFGKVVDVVLNENGCVEYLVVSYDQNYIMVPWSVTTVNFERRVVRLEVTRERLRDVPTFTRDRWPNLGDAQYRQQVFKAFGVQSNRREGSNEGTGRRPDAERRPGAEPDRRNEGRPGTQPGTTPQRPPAAKPGIEKNPPAKPETPNQPKARPQDGGKPGANRPADREPGRPGGQAPERPKDR
jgi:hypothetical protein